MRRLRRIWLALQCARNGHRFVTPLGRPDVEYCCVCGVKRRDAAA